MNLFKTRQLYESRRGASAAGRIEFVNECRHWLGLCDAHGNDHKDPAGNRMLRDRQIKAEQFSVAELAEAIVGANRRFFFDPANQGSMSGALQHRMLVEQQYPGDRRALLEATGVGVDPTAFLDINAFTSVVGGLIEVKILENFQSPMFLAEALMPAMPTKLNGQKVFNAARIGDHAIRRVPGEPHARAQFAERYVTTPATRENSLAVDVYKETVFYDLTGNILEMAASVGEWLGYRKELDVIDCFIGVTSQSSGVSAFNYGGTTYNAYSASQTIGKSTLVNQQSNALNDWTNIESSWLLFARMQDPETGTRVLTNPNVIVVNPAKLNTAKLILGAARTEVRTSGGTTQATAPTLQVRDTPALPTATKSRFTGRRSSSTRCTDATGLNLSQSNANLYWWHFERGRPFKYMQNWPLTTWQFSGGQYELLDKGIVATYGANERGIPSVWSPWHVVNNTN